MPRRLAPLALALTLCAAAPASAFTIEGPAGDVPEGQPATVTVTKEPGDLLATSVTVVPVADTALAGQDFDAQKRTEEFGLESSVEIEIPTVGDALHEPAERFDVAIEGEPESTAGVTIADDDPRPALSVSDARVDERAGTATVIVSTPSLSASDVTAWWAVGPTSATTPEDFANVGGQFTIPAGQGSAALSVPIVDDAADEGEEQFSVIVSSPGDAATIADGEGVVTIADDDERVLLVDDAGVVEGDGGTTAAQFVLRLDGPSTRVVTAAWATGDLQARAPSDYLARLGSVVFAPGETRKTVEVGVVGDDVVEPPEAFLLRLTAVGGARAARPAAVGVIADDDVAPSARSTTITAPRVTLAAPRLRGSRVAVRVTCPAGRACNGRLALYTVADRRSRVRALRRERRIGARSYRLGADAARTLTFRLSRALRREAGRAGRLKVRAYAVTLDPSGDATTRNRSATLRFRRPR